MAKTLESMPTERGFITMYTWFTFHNKRLLYCDPMSCNDIDKPDAGATLHWSQTPTYGNLVNFPLMLMRCTNSHSSVEKEITL